ncbi:protein HIRA [Parasteatoda tepidariorum]|uniref:protein HIRA n=1 Tax=Parasteatoda tepidariorum TaxID=114398 RepID=UPI001C727B16|nr:protein HIRA [Parasteatoda tepidariorum]
MKLLKPNWISHDGHPIFSVDIHPDGSRFATGGQGMDTGRIVIWNMSPVVEEADEKDENVPKVLCQMDNHLACVNCVRWSGSGKYLASCGDDKVLMIWQIGRYGLGSTAFGSNGKMGNVEHWRCVSTLRGHSGDVLDLSWSPRDTWLASCSVDNTIVIWNTLKWQEIIAVLKGHSGLVKGVSWDPVGKYIASQSDDKTLRVWRTHDWQQEAVITEPFLECGGTTHVLRLSWSPDGRYLVSAHAMNNSGPTAQIIERDGWKANRDFVGHRKAITCVRFNPNILCTQISKDSEKVEHFCCCAIGSRDRSLSVWVTSMKRPLVVIHDLFSNSVLDISWSQNGKELIVCSWDGTVAYIGLSDEEIGKPATEEEKNHLHQSLYGKSLAMTNHAVSSALSVIENPEILKLQEEIKIKKEEEDSKEASMNCSSPKSYSNDNISKIDLQASNSQSSRPLPHIKGPTDKQIETRLADGRRRITPLFIPPPPDIGEVPQPFNSRAPPTFSSSSESKSKIIIEKRDESNSQSSSQNVVHKSENGLPLVNSFASATSSPAFTSIASTTTVTNTTVTSSATSIKTSVISSVANCVPNTSSVVSSTNQLPTSKEELSPKPDSTVVLDQTEEKQREVVSSTPVSKTKESSKGAIVDASPVNSSTSLKRKSEAPLPSRPEKKRPGRPPLSQSQSQAPKPVPEKVIVQEKVSTPEKSTHLTSAIHLPPLKADKTPNVLVYHDKASGEPVYLEIENNISVGSGAVIHRLKCLCGKTVKWEIALNSKGTSVAGSASICCVVCEDKTLSIFSQNGRRLYPPIVLTSFVTRLSCSDQYVMVITSKGYVSVWDCLKLSCLVQNESLYPIMQEDTSGDLSVRGTGLSDAGVPMVSLSNGKSYVFSTDMKSWLLVSSSNNMIQLCSEHQLRFSPQELSNGRILPLAALQGQNQSKAMHLARGIMSSDPNMRQLGTISHLDSQLAASLSLKSSKEYKFWLLSLVRYLVQEGLEARLRDVCDGLLGPVIKTAKNSDWKPNILELQKRDLLKEVLLIMGSNLRFQRLFIEYRDQLEGLKT